MRLLKGLTAIALSSVLVAAACASTGLIFHSDDAIHVSRGILMQEDSSMTVEGVYIPNAIAAGKPLPDTLREVNLAASAGANTFCFDLPGIASDGSAIDPEAIQAIRDAMHQINWRSMYAIVRVFPPHAHEAMDYRENVIDAIARQMRRDTDLVFWLEGHEAEALAKRLRAQAIRLTVASAKGGHLVAASDPDQALEDKPFLLLNEVPAERGAQNHFLLAETPFDFKTHDAMLAYPKEQYDWTPDNSVLSEEEREEGFIALFNGRDLNGWVGVDNYEPAFKAENGELVYVGNLPGRDDIRTVRRFDDFILRLEYRIGRGGNSGIFLRAPRAARESKIGMEFQVLGDPGRDPHRNSTGSVYDVVAAQVNPGRPAGEWNEVEIKLDGAYGIATLNGEVLWELDLDANPELSVRLREGFIGLQDHSDAVAYRNVRIKEL